MKKPKPKPKPKPERPPLELPTPAETKQLFALCCFCYSMLPHDVRKPQRVLTPLVISARRVFCGLLKELWPHATWVLAGKHLKQKQIKGWAKMATGEVAGMECGELPDVVKMTAGIALQQPAAKEISSELRKRLLATTNPVQ